MRPVSRRPAAASTTAAAARSRSGCAASRGSSVSIDISTAVAAVAADAARRSCPLRAAGRPSTSARYSRSHAARRRAALERAVDGIALGDHEQARCIAVEAVDDPGPPRLLAAGGAARQRLGQRSAAVAAGRDGRRRRPACRRPAGARPRRRPRTAPRAVAGASGASGSPSTVDRLAAADRVAFGPGAPSTSTARRRSPLRLGPRSERLRQEAVEPRPAPPRAPQLHRPLVIAVSSRAVPRARTAARARRT